MLEEGQLRQCGRSPADITQEGWMILTVEQRTSGLGEGWRQDERTSPMMVIYCRVCGAVNIVQVTIKLHKMLCRMSCYRHTGGWILLGRICWHWMFSLGLKNVVWARHMWFGWECCIFSCFVFHLARPLSVCTCKHSTAVVKGDVFPRDKQRNDVTHSCQRVPVHFERQLYIGICCPEACMHLCSQYFSTTFHNSSNSDQACTAQLAGQFPEHCVTITVASLVYLSVCCLHSFQIAILYFLLFSAFLFSLKRSKRILERWLKDKTNGLCMKIYTDPGESKATGQQIQFLFKSFKRKTAASN